MIFPLIVDFHTIRMKISKLKIDNSNCKTRIIVLIVLSFSAHNLNILPIEISDDDATEKMHCLLNGKLAYYEMRSQHQDYVQKSLSIQYVLNIRILLLDFSFYIVYSEFRDFYVHFKRVLFHLKIVSFHHMLNENVKFKVNQIS